MTTQPHYFEPIREAAARRWDQLERDPDLAGPWHQLFKQVQSPRHVLSELLQNADDAGATQTSVRLDGCQFVFSHDGEDFPEEHLASLCRFGYSNKRALHTIGFRGIGFKSTFSLGDTVELSTPTLSLAFHRRRFTEPKWVPCASSSSKFTEIRVALGDAHREQAIKENLEDWLKSPVSLLFFRNIRGVTIGDREVSWKSLGPGPVAGSEWMALEGNPEDRFLIARSAEEEFPAEALNEIREERLVGGQEADFPPCRVEIVLGAKGQFFVVLPTGVTTSLPFAVNAPFIQDAARFKIKEPGVSPTNRWLLERVGKLAASVMLEWLQQTELAAGVRARAYGLLPDVDPNDHSLDGVCAMTVKQAFGRAIEGKLFLLTDGGHLKASKESIIIPHDLLAVWSAEQISALLDSNNRPAFSRNVSGADRAKLLKSNVIEQITREQVLNILQSRHLPKPDSWRQLLKLWAYIAPEVTGYKPLLNKPALRILPVQGKDVLYAANETVRLGEKRLLQSEKDWEFLAAHLLVLNQNWPKFLADQRRGIEEKTSDESGEDIQKAFTILGAIGLSDASDVNKVVDQVAADFFKQRVSLSGCVQLAQIAAKLGVTIGPSFRLVTRDLNVRPSDAVILFDHDGTLDAFFPESWTAAHLLHSEYTKSFAACTADEWLRWIDSGRAGLLGFAPLVQKRTSFWGRPKIEAEMRRRGYEGTITYPYVTSDFVLEDWDFEDKHWRYWSSLADQDPHVWGRAIERILAQPEGFWSKSNSARALQTATTASRRAISHEALTPSWIIRLRDLPCLPDTRGFYRKPAELLLRTPETEPFMDVEPFLNARLDGERARPLLMLLGVRDKPTGPDRLLNCLRALAMAEKPPVRDVEKWYERLDQMMDTCSTADLANIKGAFRQEKLILTQGGTWSSVTGVFLYSDDEDVPGAETIRTSVQDLALWRKLNIAERPTIELALDWLKELPSGAALINNDARRVRSLLSRHPARIWNECCHWLNLAGQWVPVQDLSYSLSMQSLIPWGHLHEWVKQKTADLQRLALEVTAAPPFFGLSHLAAHIEDRFHRSPSLLDQPVKCNWLNQLGIELGRIELEDETEGIHIRGLAAKMASTVWRTTPGLEIIPYLDDVPAGTPRSAEALWLDSVLYVENRPVARLARIVPQELGRSVGRQDVIDAIKMCFDRSPEFVTQYVEENFRLRPREAEVSVSVAKTEVSEVEAPHETKPPETPIIADQPVGDEDAGVTEDVAAQADQYGIQLDEAGSEEIETPAGKDDPEPVRQSTRPARANIMERFVGAQGFQKDGEDRFFHSDGSWIGKPVGARFWERRTSGGELVRHYIPKEHCLERDPLQMDADVWGLIDKFPNIYSLVLSNFQGEPVELAGVRLRALRESGEVTLYPATYRLVYKNDREQ